MYIVRHERYSVQFVQSTWRALRVPYWTVCTVYSVRLMLTVPNPFVIFYSVEIFVFLCKVYVEFYLHSAIFTALFGPNENYLTDFLAFCL